jgi:hypothetical protein
MQYWTLVKEELDDAPMYDAPVYLLVEHLHSRLVVAELGESIILANHVWTHWCEVWL